ncbi:hypothetical protein NDU88_001385 [Pleurodeles waltl]|uniref:Uncharacterized protein n=1 Tax=Pleurodeles waltl TaxID=8319 RepID=A0AAV7VBI3_PLEWA|nr:hypothetical protein NDU88_001385 [Pleurodeles waltl]
MRSWKGDEAQKLFGQKMEELMKQFKVKAKLAVLFQNIMAQQYMDVHYGEYDAGHYDQHMEERLVEALDFHVQGSVNKALVKALRPFAQPIFNFGVRRFGPGSGNPIPVEVNVNELGWVSNDLLNQTVNAVLSDHEYGAFRNRTTPSVQTSQHSSDSDSADLDVSPVQDKPQGKRKRKAHHAEDSALPPTGESGADLRPDPAAGVYLMFAGAPFFSRLSILPASTCSAITGAPF